MTARLLSFCCAAALAWTAASLAAEAPVERPLEPIDREHWAFQPPRRPDPPPNAAGHPVDAFLNAALAERGLQPLGEAERHTLLRRATFDLTGLPPTPAELADFLADASPLAWERVVDRLLASPAYGERWAQHWLDLARFAETDGFEFDAVRPNAWRYRDWVIAALNADLPYDRFVQLQLAGDELQPHDPQAAIATGFLLCGPDMPDLNNQDERRHVVLNELTATVGEVFLGLQVGCAQCHDHKTDPISQYDFYRLRAFFENGELFKDHPVATPEEMAAQSAAAQQRGAQAGPLEAELKALDERARQRLREQNPDLQPNAAQLRAALTEEERGRRDELSRTLSKLPPVPELPHGRVFRNGSGRSAHLMIRGDFRRPGPDVVPAYVRIADLSPAAAPPAPSRRALAEWLTAPGHPLVARVLANRLWQFHFGAGLVGTPSDFGLSGREPTHPALLDWLATELPRQGWSLKRMHRLLLTSAAYRRSARPNGPDDAAWSALVARDPENQLWGRRSLLRLEGEAIRDALLAAAGQLTDGRGGPGVRPPLPAELTGTLLKNQWNVSADPLDHRRRSVYLFVRRNLRYPLFEVFDRPDTNASCPQRARSTVAPQALALLNSELAAALAEDLARDLQQAASSDAARVRLAYLRTLSREPTRDEIDAALRFLATPEPTPLALLCLGLFNLQEFLYVD